MTWHVDPRARAAYERGDLHGAPAMALEAHLLACSECRSSIVVEPAPIERIWRAVSAEAASSPPSLLERALRRLHVPDHIARLLAATTTLSASWIAAVAVAVGFAVGAAHAGGGGLVLYLVVAPLVPLAGVAAAYGPGIDPGYEIGLAAPMRSLRLMLIRAGAVLGVSVPLVAAGSAFLPAGVGATLWLVPSVALVATGLAFASVSTPVRAAVVVAAGWVAFVVCSALVTADALRAVRGDVQGALVAVAVLGGVTVWINRDRFDVRGSR